VAASARGRCAVSTEALRRQQYQTVANLVLRWAAELLGDERAEIGVTVIVHPLDISRSGLGVGIASALQDIPELVKLLGGIAFSAQHPTPPSKEPSDA
jgi:hypothetical protein